MTKFKKLAITATLASAAMMPMASQAVNIDGVVFNPGAQFITTSLWETVLATSLGSLSGVGVVSQINCTGCGGQTWINGQNNTQLTYYFTGYTVARWYDTVGGIHAAGDEGVGPNVFANARAIDFINGNVKLFTDRVSTGTALNPSANPNVVSAALQAADIVKATDGTKWLEYAGVSTINSLTGNAGSLFASANTLNAVHAGGAGFGYLNVLNTGGLATTNFDTNSFNIGGVITDARFDSSFSNTNAGAWPLSGTASFKTAAIPEPGSLALLGLGLLGLASTYRKKSSKKA